MRWSGAAGPGSTSAGACHAPQTTATFAAPPLPRGADRLAHVRLAALLARVVVRVGLAQHGHRLGDGLERALVLGLDDVLPPALGVAVAGDLGQRAERVGAARGAAARARRAAPSCSPPAGRRSGPGRRARSAKRIACHSGEKRANGIEVRARRLVGDVGEQRDRRLHVLVRGEREQRVGLGRALDQDRVRLAAASSARSRLRAEPGPWWRMPKTVWLTARGRRGRGRPSRRARGRRSRGTPARRSGPAPGP